MNDGDWVEPAAKRSDGSRPLADIPVQCDHRMMVDQPSMSLRSKLAFLAVGLIVYGLATYLRNTDFGAVTAFAVTAISVAAHACWYLHKRRYFWPLLAIVTGAHAFVLLRWSILLPKPTIAVAPLVICDFVAIVALLIGVNHILNGSDGRGQRNGS